MFLKQLGLFAFTLIFSAVSQAGYKCEQIKSEGYFTYFAPFVSMYLADGNTPEILYAQAPSEEGLHLLVQEDYEHLHLLQIVSKSAHYTAVDLNVIKYAHGSFQVLKIPLSVVRGSNRPTNFSFKVEDRRAWANYDCVQN